MAQAISSVRKRAGEAAFVHGTETDPKWLWVKLLLLPRAVPTVGRGRWGVRGVGRLHNAFETDCRQKITFLKPGVESGGGLGDAALPAPSPGSPGQGCLGSAEGGMGATAIPPTQGAALLCLSWRAAGILCAMGWNVFKLGAIHSLICRVPWG